MGQILLIDDNDAFRLHLCQKLEAAGHQVIEARDGNEGLRLYREQAIDLVICDLFMPHKEGLETIRELRRAGEVRIIAVSGDGPAGTSPMLRVAHFLGATRVLSKPLEAEEVLEAVQDLLGAV